MKHNNLKSFNTWLNQAKNSGSQQKPSDQVWFEIQKEINSSESESNWLERILKLLAGKPRLQNGLAYGAVIISVFLIISQQSTANLLTRNEASILANEIDAKVFESQRLYEEVLYQLEQQMTAEIQDRKNEIINLYLEKIHTLDILIAECKQDLQENPYNPSIHSTLFYAYNEKLINMKAVLDINKELTS